VSDIWYYAGQDGPVGPITIGDLKDALATFSDPKRVLVWRDGFSQWMRAEDVSELGARLATPPPLPPPTPSKTVSNKPVRSIDMLKSSAEQSLGPPGQPRHGLSAWDDITLPSIVAAVLLIGIGDLSLQICFYVSIIVAVAACVLLMRPMPKLFLTRRAVAFVLILAGISTFVSTVLLQRENQGLRDACSERDRSVPATATRSIDGCTLIIQDQGAKAQDRLYAYRSRGFTYYAQDNYDRAIADYSEVIGRGGVRPITTIAD
jgi:GYF domain 2